jgi:uracil-DNA glycosylase
MDVAIDPSWRALLKDEFEQPYFTAIADFLKKEKAAGKKIYPAGPLIFNAFNSTPVDAVKVVLLGQDPYHGPNQAHGLSFSVQPGVTPPPSLVNIFKELHDDVGVPIPNTGNLQPWAEQGVLLLNAALTVEHRQANSHAKIGWERFTDAVIRRISEEKDHLVFIFWGKFAQSKAVLVDEKKHLVIKSAHPSPYAAASGFFGSRPFSKTNAFLQKHGVGPINWDLS